MTKMNMFELQKRKADDRMEVAMKYYVNEHDRYPFEKYLMGKNAFILPVRDDRGHLHHDCQMVLDSLYRYHRAHPDAHLDQLTEQALINIFQTSTHIVHVQNAGRILQFQVNNEHNKKSAFTLDCAAIYQEFLNNLQRNKQVFSTYPDTNKNFEWIIREIKRITSLGPAGTASATKSAGRPSATASVSGKPGQTAGEQKKAEEKQKRQDWLARFRSAMEDKK